MTMGPEPMMRTDWRSVLRGITRTASGQECGPRVELETLGQFLFYAAPVTMHQPAEIGEPPLRCGIRRRKLSSVSETKICKSASRATIFVFQAQQAFRRGEAHALIHVAQRGGTSDGALGSFCWLRWRRS